MVIFESLLIASQININPEPCIFCLGVYSFLLITLFIASPKVFGYSLPAVLAVFVAFSFLSIPKNKSLIKEDGLYLISSKTCPHCKKTKEFLNKNKIKYIVIDAKDTNAWYFAKSLNINKIPIAIEAKGGDYIITVGDRAIIDKFSKKEPSKSNQNSATSINNYQEDILKPQINLSNQEGCSYSITQTSSCESEDGASK
jgi:glutaredoxin